MAASRSVAVGCQLSSGLTCSSTTANSELIDHKQLLISTSHHQHDHAPHVTPRPRASEHGTYKTIEASIRFVVGCQLSSGPTCSSTTASKPFVSVSTLICTAQLHRVSLAVVHLRVETLTSHTVPALGNLLLPRLRRGKGGTLI